MCRAIWVIVYAPNDETAKVLRRAAGADVQVVGMATTTDDLTSLIATTRCDAVVIDARAPQAGVIAPTLSSKERGVVWVGEGAPQGAIEIAADGDLADQMPSAITRALIARNKR